jgi:hypothetical protein
MYRIRRESGEEVTFGSIDELGAAVVAGVVTAKAEIFHARAEKWLPIASHPHFKMAHDRINTATAPKPSGQRPALTASGQRPAITAPRPQTPQLRVMRPDAPAARAVAPKPRAPSAPPASELRLLRADTRLSSAATAPALPEMEFEPALPEVEFELLPEIVAPAEPVAAAPAPVAPVPVAPVPVAPAPAAPVPVEAVSETVVERSPASVELVSQEQQPSAVRGEVEIINPDRSMPVVNDREIPALEIPSPILDFAPTSLPVEPAARPSKAPLLIGLGLVAAVVAGIGFFVFKPSSAAPSAPASAISNPVRPPMSAAPVAVQPTPAPAPVVTPAPPTGSSTGLGGDIQPRKPKRLAGDAQTATVGDGLEPPPEELLPAAPSLGNVGDAAALPTVDAGAVSPSTVDQAKALEKTRREIDSSMRR